MKDKKQKLKLERDILELADNMAAAASMFNAHGYTNFINARQELKDLLCDVFEGGDKDSLR